jgi:hypothetical protein
MPWQRTRRSNGEDHPKVPVRERVGAFARKHRRQAPFALVGLALLGVGKTETRFLPVLKDGVSALEIR